MGGGEGEFAEGFRCGRRLLRAAGGESGGGVAALGALRQSETAQAVANQQDPERHKLKRAQEASYEVALCTPAALSR